jgi:DNA-binding transcriptional MocR family regulator
VSASTGVVLSPDRRHELVDWARDVDGYVIEDDYDAEYRSDQRRGLGWAHRTDLDGT